MNWTNFGIEKETESCLNLGGFVLFCIQKSYERFVRKLLARIEKKETLHDSSTKGLKSWNVSLSLGEQVNRTNSPFYSCVLGYQAFEQEWG